MNICEEKFELDVVHIDIYDRSDVSVSIPTNIAYSQSVEAKNGVGVTLTVTSGKTPIITMDIAWTSGADAIMENAAKVVVTEKKEIGGLIRTHSVETTLIDGIEVAMTASKKIAFTDTIVVMTTANEYKYLCNAFINVNDLNVKDDRYNHVAEVKYTAQSFSGLVPIDNIIL